MRIAWPDRGDRLRVLAWIAANDGRNETHRLYHRPWFKAFVRWLQNKQL